jgi:hypothetical protein
MRDHILCSQAMCGLPERAGSQRLIPEPPPRRRLPPRGLTANGLQVGWDGTRRTRHLVDGRAVDLLAMYDEGQLGSDAERECRPDARIESRSRTDRRPHVQSAAASRCGRLRYCQPCGARLRAVPEAKSPIVGMFAEPVVPDREPAAGDSPSYSFSSVFGPRYQRECPVRFFWCDVVTSYHRSFALYRACGPVAGRLTFSVGRRRGVQAPRGRSKDVTSTSHRIRVLRTEW